MRIGNIIIFYLSKLWKATFSILCDVIGCRVNLKLITLESERVKKCSPGRIDIFVCELNEARDMNKTNVYWERSFSMHHLVSRASRCPCRLRKRESLETTVPKLSSPGPAAKASEICAAAVPTPSHFSGVWAELGARRQLSCEIPVPSKLNVAIGSRSETSEAGIAAR